VGKKNTGYKRLVFKPHKKIDKSLLAHLPISERSRGKGNLLLRIYCGSPCSPRHNCEKIEDVTNINAQRCGLERAKTEGVV
jgi:hypothetical protein